MAFSKKRQAELPKPKRKSFVYLLHCDGFHKVGIAVDIKARLNCIQVSNPHPVNLVRLWRCNHALDTERMIHHTLVSRGFHARGEWFKLTSDALHELIDSMRHREC